jgi:hypothetical protein
MFGCDNYQKIQYWNGATAWNWQEIILIFSRGA